MIFIDRTALEKAEWVCDIVCIEKGEKTHTEQ